MFRRPKQLKNENTAKVVFDERVFDIPLELRDPNTNSLMVVPLKPRKFSKEPPVDFSVLYRKASISLEKLSECVLDEDYIERRDKWLKDHGHSRDAWLLSRDLSPEDYAQLLAFFQLPLSYRVTEYGFPTLVTAATIALYWFDPLSPSVRWQHFQPEVMAKERLLLRQLKDIAIPAFIMLNSSNDVEDNLEEVIEDARRRGAVFRQTDNQACKYGIFVALSMVQVMLSMAELYLYIDQMKAIPDDSSHKLPIFMLMLRSLFQPMLTSGIQHAVISKIQPVIVEKLRFANLRFKLFSCNRLLNKFLNGSVPPEAKSSEKTAVSSLMR